ANHVAVIQKKPVLIMSGEMPKEQIAMRLCCAIAPADIGIVRNAPHLLPKDEFTAYTNAVVMLQKVPMYINDMSRPSIANIRESIRKVKHQYGTVGVV
ncbi:DnaB-like helicase C-terminal domain-containing protein, partial [Acinetobacter baumannii]